MKGDFSRQIFDPKKHYNGVLLQQGRVLVDADWNEEIEILRHHERTEMRDIIGGCGGPAGNAGFKLEADSFLQPAPFPPGPFPPGPLPLEPEVQEAERVEIRQPVPLEPAISQAAPLAAGESYDDSVTGAAAGRTSSPVDDEFRAGLVIDQYAKDLVLSAGRYYVDGILIENEQRIRVASQPDLPPHPAEKPFSQEGHYVAYLDVWDRHITAIDDPSIREVALGGPDTTTRSRTIWQVKFWYAGTGTAPECRTNIDAFNAFIAPPTGRMSAGTEAPSIGEGPCIVPPGAGFRGLENQLYRVEIHDAGTAMDNAAATLVAINSVSAPGVSPVELTLAASLGVNAGDAIEIVPTVAGSGAMDGVIAYVSAVKSGGTVLALTTGMGGLKTEQILKARKVNATFKWSRDNGSVLTIIEKMNGAEITVHDLGPDSVLGFAPEQWVEISDDVSELNGRPGTLAQIKSIDIAKRIITLKSAPAALDTTRPEGVNSARHPKLRRWDGVGAVKFITGTDGPIGLEDGVQVRFMAGTYRTGDYWTIPARTATTEGAGNIEWPVSGVAGTPLMQPPFGIRHHYCRIGVLTIDAGGRILDLDDCRCLFSPLTRLSGFFYVGGDGQETTWLSPPLTGQPELAQPMPQPLQVGVFNVGMSNNCAPVRGAHVRFTIEDDGKLAADMAGAAGSGIVRTFNTVTDNDGIATVYWRPEWDVAKPSQTVVARLVDSADVPQTQKVVFNGTLNIASRVAYDPAPCTNLGPGIRSVEDALDAICRRLTNCHNFLRELRANGVVRDSKGVLGFEVLRDDDPRSLVIRVSRGIAYVCGCRFEIDESGPFELDPDMTEQMLVVDCKGKVILLQKDMLEEIEPTGAKYAKLASVSASDGHIQRIVDLRRDLTWLDDRVDDTEAGVAASHQDARGFVPLLSQTLPHLRFRDGRNRFFRMKDPSCPVFDGRSMWISSPFSNAVTRIERFAEKPNSGMEIHIGLYTYQGVFDGRCVWFTAMEETGIPCLVAIDTVTLEHRRVALESPAAGIAFDGIFVWVGHPRSMSLSQIDVERNKVTGKVDLSPYKLYPMALAFDGEWMWASGASDDTMAVRVDPQMVEDPEPVRHSLARSMHIIQAAYDGTRMWLLANNGQVALVDALTFVVQQSIATANNMVKGLVFDGTYMWHMVEGRTISTFREEAFIAEDTEFRPVMHASDILSISDADAGMPEPVSKPAGRKSKSASAKVSPNTGEIVEEASRRISPDLHTLIILSSIPPMLIKVDPRTLTKAGTIELPSTPMMSTAGHGFDMSMSQLAFDGTHVWYGGTSRELDSNGIQKLLVV